MVGFIYLTTLGILFGDQLHCQEAALVALQQLPISMAMGCLGLVLLGPTDTSSSIRMEASVGRVHLKIIRRLPLVQPPSTLLEMERHSPSIVTNNICVFTKEPPEKSSGRSR